MTRASEPQATCTLGAVGDIALCGTTAAMMRAHGADWPFAAVRRALARADVLFGNLESVLIPPDFPEERVNRRGLVSRADAAGALQRAGFDVLSVANNHVLDAGTTGLFHTADVLARAGLLAGGVGRTQEEARLCRHLDRGGLRFGFLCYAEDSNYVLSTAGPCHAYYDPAVVLEDIARARPTVDVLVVSVHADLEFVETPSPERRRAFREFAHAGATIVLGHHPHVPQGVERVGSSLVAYSLGNFVFHARTSRHMRPHLPATARSFVLLVEVSRAGVESFERVPVLIGSPPDERPALAEGAEATGLLSELEHLDGLAGDDAAVAQRWRSAALERLQSSARTIAGAADDPTRLLHTVGRLLYVAENRAWVDEVERAARARWERQREEVHDLERPSFATEVVSSRSRLPARLGAVLRRVGRRAGATRSSA